MLDVEVPTLTDEIGDEVGSSVPVVSWPDEADVVSTGLELVSVASEHGGGGVVGQVVMVL